MAKLFDVIQYNTNVDELLIEIKKASEQEIYNIITECDDTVKNIISAEKEIDKAIEEYEEEMEFLKEKKELEETRYSVEKANIQNNSFTKQEENDMRREKALLENNQYLSYVGKDKEINTPIADKLIVESGIVTQDEFESMAIKDKNELRMIYLDNSIKQNNVVKKKLNEIKNFITNKIHIAETSIGEFIANHDYKSKLKEIQQDQKADLQEMKKEITLSQAKNINDIVRSWDKPDFVTRAFNWVHDMAEQLVNIQYNEIVRLQQENIKAKEKAQIKYENKLADKVFKAGLNARKTANYLQINRQEQISKMVEMGMGHNKDELIEKGLIISDDEFRNNINYYIQDMERQAEKQARETFKLDDVMIDVVNSKRYQANLKIIEDLSQKISDNFDFVEFLKKEMVRITSQSVELERSGKIKLLAIDEQMKILRPDLYRRPEKLKGLFKAQKERELENKLNLVRELDNPNIDKMSYEQVIAIANAKILGIDDSVLNEITPNYSPNQIKMLSLLANSGKTNEELLSVMRTDAEKVREINNERAKELSYGKYDDINKNIVNMSINHHLEQDENGNVSNTLFSERGRLSKELNNGSSLEAAEQKIFENKEQYTPEL